MPFSLRSFNLLIAASPAGESPDLSDVIALVSVIAAALAVASNILFQLLAARREKDKIRYGIVYQERFRVCKELYTRLSRLRDAVERYTYIENCTEDRRRLAKSVHRVDDAFRRSLRQNDVILEESMAQDLNRIWTTYKQKMYEYQDATGLKRLVDTLPTDARKELLNALDQARACLRPQIRRAYGIAS